MHNSIINITPAVFSNAGFGYRPSRFISMSSGYKFHVVTICIPTQEHRKAEKKYFNKMEMSQLYI